MAEGEEGFRTGEEGGSCPPEGEEGGQTCWEIYDCWISVMLRRMCG